MGFMVIALIVVGFTLLFIETLLPGMVAGILGGICLVAAVILGYNSFGFRGGNWILLGVTTGLVIGIACFFKYFPGSRVGQIFVSKGVAGDSGVDRSALLNRIGTAYTDLRPSGTALIDGKRVDVVTEGAMIERGTPVKVVAIEGLRVVVRAT